MVIQMLTCMQYRINNSGKCNNATGPALLGVLLCVKFVLYYMQQWLDFRCPRQTLRKGPYI